MAFERKTQRTDVWSGIRVEQIFEVLRRLLTKPQSLSATTTLTASNTTVTVDASGGSRTIYLPLAAQHASRVYTIKKTDSGPYSVFVYRSGTDVIDGALNYVLLYQYDAVTVISDGTKWLVLNGVDGSPAGTPVTSGTATLDFGAFPGASDATVTVTGQAGILAGSTVQCWLEPTATSDHTADEHLYETLAVRAGNIVAGTGFTIYGWNTNQVNEPLELAGVSRYRSASTTVHGAPGLPSVGGRGTLIYGQWTVRWLWF